MSSLDVQRLHVKFHAIREEQRRAQRVRERIQRRVRERGGCISIGEMRVMSGLPFDRPRPLRRPKPDRDARRDAWNPMPKFALRADR